MTDFNHYTERRGTACMKYDGASLMKQKDMPDRLFNRGISADRRSGPWIR